MIKIWVIISLIAAFMAGIIATPSYVAVKNGIDSGDPSIFDEANSLGDLPLLVVKDTIKSVRFILNGEMESFFEVFYKAFLFMLVLPFLLMVSLFFRVIDKFSNS